MVDSDKVNLQYEEANGDVDFGNFEIDLAENVDSTLKDPASN